MRHYPPHLRRVATLPCEIKNSNFLHIFSKYERKWKQLKFVCQPLCFVPLQIQTFYKNYVFVAEYHVDCWLTLLWKLTSAMTKFGSHKLITKVITQKNSEMENIICNQYGERFGILNAENIKICEWIIKLEAINMQFVCILFYICWIY